MVVHIFQLVTIVLSKWSCKTYCVINLFYNRKIFFEHTCSIRFKGHVNSLVNFTMRKILCISMQKGVQHLFRV